MTNLAGSKPFPVLGRLDDYSSASFRKEITVDLSSGKIVVDNQPNLVNSISDSAVKDYLVIENPQTAFRDLVELAEGVVEVQLNLSKMLGLTQLTVLQISQREFELKVGNEVNDFFVVGQGETGFLIRPGEVLGFGDTVTLDITPSTGSSWIIFSNTGDPTFDFIVEHGLSGKIVVSMGSKLYSLAMNSLTDRASKIWANLAFAKPAIEFAISEMFSNLEIEEGTGPSWVEGLKFRLQGIGVSGLEDVKDLKDLQRAAMKLLEEPALLPLVELLTESAED